MRKWNQILAYALLVPLVFPLCMARATTLQQAIRQTINDNPEVTVVGHLRQAADQEVGQARAGYFPEVDLAASYGRVKTENVAPFPSEAELNESRFAIIARQMLFDGFYTHNEVYRTEAKTNAEAYLQQGTAEDFALDVAEYYLAVLRDQELVRIAKERLDTHESIYKMIKQRGDSGLGRQADTSQALTRLESARSDYLSAQSNLIDDQSTYYRLTDMQPVGLIDPPMPSTRLLPTSQQMLINQSISSNAIVKSAVQDIQEARGQNDSAKSEWLSPKLDLVVGANYNENVSGLEGRNDDQFALLEVNYTLFRGGGDWAREKQTAKLLDESMDIHRKAIREAVEKSKFSWNAYENTLSQVGPLLHRRDEAKKTVDAYQSQFYVGKRTLVDLLNSENDYFDAKVAYVDNYYKYKLAVYRMLNSENKLLTFFKVPLPSTSLKIYKLTGQE